MSLASDVQPGLDEFCHSARNVLPVWIQHRRSEPTRGGDSLSSVIVYRVQSIKSIYLSQPNIHKYKIILTYKKLLYGVTGSTQGADAPLCLVMILS